MGCYNSCVVGAAADDVWAALRRFHDMSWASGVIETVDVVGDVKDGDVGAKRVLNGAIHETLKSLDDAARTFSYTIDAGPDPVGTAVDFVGFVRASPVTQTGGTFVEWATSWRSGEGDIAGFCDPIYQALLSALQAHFAS